MDGLFSSIYCLNLLIPSCTLVVYMIKNSVGLSTIWSNIKLNFSDNITGSVFVGSVLRALPKVVFPLTPIFFFTF